MVRPDPIPNSAVKHSLADGSSLIDSARVGSRQSFKKAETKTAFRLFAFLNLTLNPALNRKEERRMSKRRTSPESH